MITISSENELVEIGSYEELLLRPRFQPNLDPAKLTLTRLIGVYGVPEECPCGLSNCHTGHKRGYLAATDDGIETNIGNKCGKNIFGAEWHVLRNTLNADLREKKHREAVGAFQARIPDYRARLSTLRDQPMGAHWAWLSIRKLFDDLPHCVWPKLERMIKEDDGAVLSDRLATDGETAAEEARTGKPVKRPHYVTQLHGYIEGLSAMQPANDFREILSKNLVEPLGQIEGMSVETARASSLAAAAKWVASVDSQIARVRDSLEIARHLLTKNNLLQLQHLGLNSSEVAQLRRAIAGLPQSYS